MLKHLFTRRQRETTAERLSRLMCQPQRVLFVDDNHMLRDVLSKLAQTEFMMEVVGVSTLTAARVAIAEQDFDIIILDQVLTNGQGIRLYEELVAARSHAHIVFLTGYATEEFRKKVEAIGPARVHSKDSVLNLHFLGLLLEELGATRAAVA